MISDILSDAIIQIGQWVIVSNLEEDDQRLKLILHAMKSMQAARIALSERPLPPR